MTALQDQRRRVIEEYERQLATAGRRTSVLLNANLELLRRAKTDHEISIAFGTIYGLSVAEFDDVIAELTAKTAPSPFERALLKKTRRWRKEIAKIASRGG